MRRDLRNSSNFNPILESKDKYWTEAWVIVKDEQEKLLDKSWKAQLRGDSRLSEKLNKYSNYITYLVYYGSFINDYVEQTRGAFPCIELNLKDRFNIECVEKELLCISTDSGVDFVNLWKQLYSIPDIPINEELCNDDCNCLGVGEYFIDEYDECDAYIVGDCDERGDLEPEFGLELASCEFPTEEIIFGTEINQSCEDLNICK